MSRFGLFCKHRSMRPREGNGHVSVPAFGKWEGKVSMPDYSVDFSRFREHRRQNKSRVSLGNKEELLNNSTINGDHSCETLENIRRHHQGHAISTLVSVLAFGEWEGKVGMPYYSVDFSRIREHRRQNKSRVSLINEEELLNNSTINGGHNNEMLENIRRHH